jgi:signal transduction histidine kinase
MEKTYNAEIGTTIKLLILIVLLVFIWAVLSMMYIDRFIPPFNHIELWLMPWKAPLPRHATIDMRLAIMQEQLIASNKISNYALVIMIISFASLSIYLSVVYQQKQRRARENMVLLLKNEEIARRNEFIRYISATIGHEFKNNLGRIKRRIDLLPTLPQEAKERIDGNLDKLFADIDIFKKISDEREAGLVDFKNTNLKIMLDDIISHYSDLVDIEIHETVTLPMIFAAPPLLRTVFENIIDNAVKYKKPGTSRARIFISCSIDKDGNRRYVTVSIRDEGMGMDERLSDQCFYKGKGSGESWGQGLYFTKYVIGLHAGRIRIGKEYTAPGKGTEIIINLPYVEEASYV